MNNTSTQTMTEADALWLAEYRLKEELRKQRRRESRVRRKAKLLAYEKAWRAKPENQVKIKAKNARIAERVRADKAKYKELQALAAAGGQS